MRGKRIDRLLADTLANGRIPEDATIEERNEVLRLIEASRLLESSRAGLNLEAQRSLPNARARFERYVVAGASGGPVRAPAGIPTWRRRGFALAGSAAAAVAIVIGAILVGIAVSGSGVETASAMEIGDFVHLEGTLVDGPASDGRTVQIDTVAGRVTIEVERDASVADGDLLLPVQSLSRGDSLVVAGTVTGVRRLEASSLSRVGQGATPVPERAIRRLVDYREGLEGSVVSFALAPEGDLVRVVLETSNGDRILVTVPAAAARTLLEDGIGSRVRVARGEPGRPGVLALERLSGPQRPPPGQRVPGVVTALDATGLTLETRGGELTVVLTDSTRLVLPDDLRGTGDRQDIIGRRAMVAGHFQRDGQLVADVVVVGERHVPGEPLDSPPPTRPVGR